MIMADKGFDIQEMVATRRILVNVPPRLASKHKQLQIYVEKAIKRGHHFKILNDKFPSAMYDLVSNINLVCMYLTDFDNPLVG